MRVTVSDVVSPSYFPLTAAVELGFFKAEGLDAEFIFPPVDPGRVLIDGDVDFYGASPYIAFGCLSEWRGGKILCALSQYTYWFLAVRADLGAVEGDMSALKGLRIKASGQPSISAQKAARRRRPRLRTGQGASGSRSSAARGARQPRPGRDPGPDRGQRGWLLGQRDASGACDPPRHGHDAARRPPRGWT
jgi:NMT1/THI5 like